MIATISQTLFQMIFKNLNEKMVVCTVVFISADNISIFLL